MTIEYPDVQMTTRTESFVVHYPEAIKFAEEQASVIWLDTQFNVEKDVQGFRVDFDEGEQHAVKTTLKLFTHYERHVGEDYWTNCVMKWFPRPEIQRLGSTNAFVEFNSHMPFYDKLNRALGLDTDEFYLSYVDDPVLKQRMDFINNAVSDGDRLHSIATFSMVEGSVLYSNFGLLKFNQAVGNNKLITVVAGINESVRDEDLHSQAGAWLYHQYKRELEDAGYTDSDLEEKILHTANLIREHEYQIIDMTFEKWKRKGLTAHQMQNFVDSRIDLCLSRLGIEPMYKPTYNPVSEWFYRGITGYQFHDFFRQKGREYKRTWKKDGFKWGGQ